MGATASINAASKKYKPSEPIEVKFHNVVKYDDGDEKAFKDGFHPRKQQPLSLSLLASAIRMLENKPKAHPIPQGYLTDNYSRQVRPRSAYVVLKKGSQSSLSPSNQNGVPPNGLHPKLSPHQKQYKAKQNLYMSLISPNGSSLKNSTFPLKGLTMPQRIRVPPHMQMNYGQPKSNTLPRYYGRDGKRVKVNRKIYMDMIRPVMATAQYYKLGVNSSIPATPSSQRTISRQSHYAQTLCPRPPNESQRMRKLHPNSVTSTPQQERHVPQRQITMPQRETFTQKSKVGKPCQQSQVKSEHNSSIDNSFTPQRNIHLPRLARKTKDEASLNSSLNSQTRGQIPKGHPDNVIPLYFRKSLAYSPQYKHKELLSNPL